MREHGIWVGGGFIHCIDGRPDGKGSRELLRVYGSLTPAQRQTLLGGDGLAYAALSPAAQRWLRRALQARLDNDSWLRLEPVDPERVVLSLRARPLQRSVTAAPDGFRILYQPPGVILKYDARVERVEELYYRGLVPAAPGVVRPPDGQSLEVTFLLRAPETPNASFLLLLPCMGWRSPATPAESTAPRRDEPAR
jgi:hypothetical protein